jgi:ABC-2 type transport system permease protein
MSRWRRIRRFGQRTAAVALKEVMHILRDPQVLLFGLGLPILLLFLFGYGVTFDIDHVPVAVVDQDRGRDARELVRAFETSDAFEVVARHDDADAVQALFRNGAAKAALVIPPDFGRRLARGETASAQLLVDGADNTTASVALGFASAVAQAESQRRLVRALDLLGGRFEAPVEVRARTFFNPELKSSVFLVPGLMAIILVLVAVMLTALTVAREYERGSLEQLFATPVGRLEVVLGKLGPYFLLALLQVLVVLAVGVTLFDVPVRGSLPLLFATASVFLLAMLAQGLFISAATRSQMVASQVALISTFLPGLLLSGFVFPIDGMPAPLQLVHALRAILLRGNGLDVVAADLAAMGAFFLVMLALAVGRFRRTLA